LTAQHCPAFNSAGIGYLEIRIEKRNQKEGMQLGQDERVAWGFGKRGG